MFRSVSTFLNTNIFLGLITGVILLTCVAAKSEDLTRDFVAGMPKNFPPHFYTDPESEKPVGFSVDVMDAVAKKSGINIRYEIFENWKETFQAAKDGRVDIIPNLGFTTERKTFADYTPPYETFRLNFYIRASSLSLQSVADIENAKIGVVSTNKARFILEKKGKFNLVIFESFDELAWKLISGDVDCIALPEPVMSYLVQKAGIADQIKVLGNPIIEIKRGIGVSKGNTELVKLLSSILDDFILSQDFKDIYTKWYGEPEPYWTPTRIGIVGAILLFSVFSTIAIWRYRFIIKVNKELEITIHERTKKIVESEKRLREAQHMAHLAHWSLDPTTGSTVWSEEMYNILGLDPANGSPPISKHQGFIHPDDWGWFEATVKDAAERGTPYDIILRIVHPDGSLHFINSICTPITDDKGVVVELHGTTQDITERTKADTKLQLVNNALEDSLNAFDIVNADGIFTYVNKAYVEMWGYDSDEEIIGTTTVEHCLDPEQPAHIIHALQTTGKFEGEFTAKRKDGSTFEVLMSSRLAHDPDGNVIYPTSSLDMTDLMRARNELRKEKDRLQLALDVVEMGAWDLNLVDHSSHRTFRHDQIFGYNSPLKEWTYEMFLDHVLLEDREEVNRKFSEATANQSNWDFECRIRRVDGEIRWISAVGRHGEPVDGIVQVMVGTVLDITESKQTEGLLNQSNQLLEASQRIACVGGWELDLTTNKLFWTDETYRIHDTSPAEFNPTVDAGVGYFLPESRRIISDALQVAMEKGEGYDLVLETLTTKGRRIDVRTTCEVTHREGRPFKLTGIFHDITERKQSEAEKQKLETQLQQAQKMDSIGTLAGGIAHDFNNILSSVIGFTELALDAVEQQTPIADDLQEVYTAGIRAKDLVQQILTFARQSDEKLELIQVDFVIKEVLKFLRSSIPTTIEIKQEIASASLIMGNTIQIHRVMMNLCTNAAHAMDAEGGILEVTLNDITIDKATHVGGRHLKFGNYIEIKVLDTGNGIAPENIDKIFEPYFTTKGPGEGTGMGLAMVHGIVETYGGKIVVESRFGKGTVFTIYLPVARGSKTHQQYKVEELPTGQERVLFVDDEPQIAKMANRILSQLGYAVTIKTNSLEALELFSSKPNDFDLVISDVTMPQMPGDLLTQKLIEIRPDIPVILCTGYSKRISEQEAFDMGVKAIAYKPIVKEELARKIRDVLDD